MEKKKKIDLGTIIIVGITLIIVIICIAIIIFNNSNNKTSYVSNNQENNKNVISSTELISNMMLKGYTFENINIRGDIHTSINDNENQIIIERILPIKGEEIYLFFDKTINEESLDLNISESLYTSDNQQKRNSLNIWLKDNDVSIKQIKEMLIYYYLTHNVDIIENKNNNVEIDEKILEDKNDTIINNVPTPNQDVSTNNVPINIESDEIISEAPSEVNSIITPPVEDSIKPEETISLGKSNALSSAKNYLSFMAFSYSGLIHQLEYEGYTNEEATYAVDNCGANWNEQASKKAQNYLSIMPFSRAELLNQLIYEGFTSEQAEYGVTSVGY